jgi:hypothetical protein
LGREERHYNERNAKDGEHSSFHVILLGNAASISDTTQSVKSKAMIGRV